MIEPRSSVETLRELQTLVADTITWMEGEGPHFTAPAMPVGVFWLGPFTIVDRRVRPDEVWIPPAPKAMLYDT